jgi:hypothetical protein
MHAGQLVVVRKNLQVTADRLVRDLEFFGEVYSADRALYFKEVQNLLMAFLG